MLCNAMQCNSMQSCNEMEYHAMECNVCSVVYCSVVQRNLRMRICTIFATMSTYVVHVLYSSRFISFHINICQHSPSDTGFDGFGSAPTLAAAPILPLLLDPPQPEKKYTNITMKKYTNIAASKAFRAISDSRIFNNIQDIKVL